MNRRLQIVLSICQDAAIERGLIRRHLIELRLNTKKLVIGKQILQPRLSIQPAAYARVHLRSALL
jgi:hypothetical protein